MQATSSCEAETGTSLNESITALREAGDAEGVARFVMNGGLTRVQRRATAFTPAETAAMARLEVERTAARLRQWRSGQQRRAYDRLSAYRQRCDLYTIARLTVVGDQHIQAVLTGEELMPDVPRFELTAEELSVVQSCHEASEATRRCYEADIPETVWVQIGAGEYRSADGRWGINRIGPRAWAIYEDGELVDSWERSIFGDVLGYSGWPSLAEAKESVEQTMEMETP